MHFKHPPEKGGREKNNIFYSLNLILFDSAGNGTVKRFFFVICDSA